MNGTVEGLGRDKEPCYLQVCLTKINLRAGHR